MAEDVLESLLGRVIGLTTRKKVLAEEIRNLTIAQSELLVPEKAEELLALLEKKQLLMDEVSRIDDEVVQLDEKIKSATKAQPEEDLSKTFNNKWKEIDKLRQEMIAVLNEIRVFDEQNRQKINEEYRKLKAGMESLHARRGSFRAYQGIGTRSGGYFIDEKK